MCESPFPEISHPKQRAFLLAYCETCNVFRACKVSKVGRSSHYRWLAEDPKYSEAFDLAKEQASDRLEAEAIRRAFEGVEEPTGWYKGEPGGYVRRYSDTLLIFLLKGAFPDRYTERTELKGAFAHIDLNKLPDEALARIASGEHPNSVLASLAQQYVPPHLPAPAAKLVNEDLSGEE